MKRKNLIFLLIALGLLGLTACGNKDFKTYENDKLGFSLDLPRSWDNKYLVEEDLDEDTVYFMHIANSKDYENGMLFSITRRIGGLITEEDIENGYVPGEIIGKEAGYTFIKGLPTDIQYGPEAVVDTKEYEEMSSDIAGILKSFKLKDLERPRGKKEGYVKEGTNFFTVDIKEDWKLEKSKDSPFKWEVLNGEGRPIGGIELLVYDSYDTEEEAKVFAYKEDSNIFRKIKIELDEEYKEDLGPMEESLEILGDSYTALDGIYSLRTNLDRGGKSLVARIKNLEQDTGLVTSLEIVSEDGSQLATYETEYPEIIPLEKNGNYGLYGVYIFTEDILKGDRQIEDRLFEFIINRDGKVVGLIEL